MGGQRRVLVVEDEVLSQRYLQRQLEKLGFLVVAATNSGEEAVRLAAQTEPDLILMDISLAGGIDGIAAAQRIKERSNVPIIFMTGYSDMKIRERAEEMSPVGFVVKPVDSHALRRAVSSLLGDD
jgi:CheY-like chemotaxis protein